MISVSSHFWVIKTGRTAKLLGAFAPRRRAFSGLPTYATFGLFDRRSAEQRLFGLPTYVSFGPRDRRRVATFAGVFVPTRRSFGLCERPSRSSKIVVVCELT